jgi:mono/diheme cytochrome c family protein
MEPVTTATEPDEEADVKQSARDSLIGALATIAVLVVAGLIFVYSGAYNVAATEDHTAIGRWLLNTAQHRSVAVRAGGMAPAPAFDSALVAHGFEHYRDMCVVCHGAPGVERGEFGQGITPTPPDLSEEAAEWSAQELFWITKHGIKMAGMPAFGPTHSDEEIWGLVAFLQEMAGMSDEEYASWEARYTTGRDTTNTAAGHTHAPGTPDHPH